MADENLDIGALMADAPSGTSTDMKEPGSNPAPTGTETALEPVQSQEKPATPVTKPKGDATAAVQLGKDGKPVQTQPVGDPPPADPIAARLEVQGEAIQELLRKATEVPAATTKPNEPAKPYYNIDIPDPLIAAINSEDPAEAKQGLRVLTNGIANRVWMDMQKHLAEVFVPQVQQLISSHSAVTNQAAEIQKDFYGTYKALDKPQFKPLVLEVAKELAGRMGPAYKGWNAEFRDQVGKTVMELLASATGAAPPAAGQQPQKKQPFVANGSARQDTGGGKNPFLDSVGA